MEVKHFSHNHNLIFHQLPQGREIKCSGCQSQGSGNVYTCWQCSFFLHEQCFTATRSLKTPSHPLHSLTLVPYPTHQSGSFYCDICKQIGSGLSYCCAECEFDLHVHCALSSNQPFHSSSYANPGFNPPQHGSYMPPPPNYPSHHHPDANFTSPTIPDAYNQATLPPQPPQSYPVQPPNYPVQNNTNPNFPSPSVPIVTNQAPPMPTPPAAYPAINNQAGQSNQPQNNTIPVFPPTSAPLNIPLTSSNQPKVNEIRHFSHQHALKELEFTKQDGKKCYGCGYIIDGSGYSCVDLQCNFNLDKSCFESPNEVKHKSHLDHTLKLLANPPYQGGTFTCNACIKEGTGFVYNCATCSFDLHVDCVSWPEKVKREDHQHPLTLFFSSPTPPNTEGQPEVTTICDVCQTAIHEMAWTYSCHECDFATHLECVINQGVSVQKSDEELINEAAIKLKVLQLLLSGRAEIIL
ncbi:hypothetical protein LIER_34349 [Lithospermum erythrorhizon]|uniref:DC1 domain-containing protein n=1 Tax=Lithospermum erythrorhizon TaxID=34254 RepID=A0AAV3S422_LITER